MITEQLEQYRLKQNLTNEDLAKMLGIHTVSWYRIKRTGNFNARFLINAQKILTTNVPRGGKDVMPKRHQRTRGQNLRGFRGWLRELVRKVLHADIFIGG